MPPEFPREIPGLVRGVRPPRRKKRPPFSPKALFRRLLLVALLLVALVLVADILGKPFARCMKLRHTIKDALASATQVRVIENSRPSEQPPSHSSSGSFEIFSRTSAITLPPDKVAELRASLPISLDFGKESEYKFRAEYRIAALQPDGTTFTLDLCFRCGELSLSGEEKHIFPLRWKKKLSEFLASLGLKPDGPWENR